MNKFNIKLSAFLASVFFLNHSGLHADQRLDRRLINALASNSVSEARTLLDAGANPQAVLGEKLEDHAVCTAIDNRNSELLELLLEYGASPTYQINSGPYELRTPIACAIEYYNPAAFKLLLEIGASANANLCAECEEKYQYTTLIQAVNAAQFPMALSIATKEKPSTTEIEDIIYILENTSFSNDHPWSDERWRLVEWIRKQGYSVNLSLPDHPPEDNDSCVFSVRDREEGLAKGTVCN